MADKRKPFFGGNWKDKIVRVNAAKTLAQNLRCMDIDSEKTEVVVFPQTSHLYQVANILRPGFNIGVGAQSMGMELEGPSTGETPLETMVDAGAKYVLLGHSEQRHDYGEDNLMIHKKLAAILRYNEGVRHPNQRIIPVLCIGETLEERKGEFTQGVVEGQLIGGLNPSMLQKKVGDNYLEQLADVLIVAYEPVWAIGTGETATPEQAQEVYAFIRKTVCDWNSQFGPNPDPQAAAKFAEGLRIIYGGSANPDNIENLMLQPDIDGALVGGASLKSDSFGAIVEKGTEAHHKKAT